MYYNIMQTTGNVHVFREKAQQCLMGKLVYIGEVVGKEVLHAWGWCILTELKWL